METYMGGQAIPLTGAALKGINEQDIDHLLVEELQCSPHFLKWFLGHLKNSSDISVQFSRYKLERSASRSGVSGETDILLQFYNENEIVIQEILIENKHTSTFTLDQPERYADAVAKLRIQGISAAAVLVAPRLWLSQCSTGCFDTVISYEDLEDYFRNAALHETHQESIARMRFKCFFINQAVVRAKATNPVNISEPTQRFREYCFARCREAYYELMPRDMKGAQNVWLHYHVAVGTLRHNTTRHYVGLIIKAPLEQVTDRLHSILREGMQVEQVGTGCAALIRTPPVNKIAPPESQIEALEECFVALRRLWYWANDNKSELTTIMGRKKC